MKVPVTGGVCRWRGGCGSQAKWLQWHYTIGGVDVPQGSQCDLWYSKNLTLNGQRSDFSQPTRGAGPTHIMFRRSPYPSVQTWGFGPSECLLRAFHYTPLPQSWHSTWHSCHGWQWLCVGLPKVFKKSALALYRPDVWSQWVSCLASLWMVKVISLEKYSVYLKLTWKRCKNEKLQVQGFLKPLDGSCSW